MVKRIFAASSFGLYILAFLLFFMVGLFAAMLFGAGKDQMLAGGPIVLFWGLIFAVLAVVASVILALHTSPKTIVTVNWVLLVIVVLLYGIGYYSFNKRSNNESAPEPPTQTTVPLEPATSF